MTAYSRFASVYDELMTDIPYGEYAALLETACGDLKGKRVLDVGCGTGTLSCLLSKKGADVTGIDLSHPMIEVAQKRAADLSLPVRFKQLPMQEVADDSQYDAAVISIDSINYLSDAKEVKETLRRLYKALTADGCLLFDVHSLFKMDEIFLESPFVFDNGRIAYIWHTYEGEEAHSVHSDLSFFVQQENGLYERFDEHHYQRTFPVMSYVEFLQDAGFSIERIFADWEDEPPHDESERIFIQARK